MTAEEEIISFINRILRLKEESDAIAKDIRDIYGEAKDRGYNKTAIGDVVTYARRRAKDREAAETRSADFNLYLSHFLGITQKPSHTHTREGSPPHDPDTGEIIETRAAADDAPGSTAESREGEATGTAEPEATDRAAAGGDLAASPAPTETAADDHGDDAEECIGCGEPIKPGEECYRAVDGGYLHATCAGGDPRSFVDENDEPLGPGSPMPTPRVWTTDSPRSPPLPRQPAEFAGSGRAIGGETSRAGPKPYPLDERGLEHAGEIPSFMRRA